VSDGSKAVTIEVASDNSISATSIKPYNVLNLPQFQLQQSLVNLLAGGAALVSGTAIATIIGILTLIYEFLEKTSKEFCKQDAEILLVIYKLGKICHLSTIKPTYQSLFKKEIEEEQIQVSLILLSSYKTVIIKGNEVELIEHVTVVRI